MEQEVDPDEGELHNNNVDDLADFAEAVQTLNVLQFLRLSRHFLNLDGSG